MKTLEKVNGDYQTQLNDWIDHEKAALDLINVVGKLWFERSIELILFRNQLVDRSASEIMNLHLYAKNIVKKPITVYETVALANEILNSKVGQIQQVVFGNQFVLKLKRMKEHSGTNHRNIQNDLLH